MLIQSSEAGVCYCLVSSSTTLIPSSPFCFSFLPPDFYIFTSRLGPEQSFVATTPWPLKEENSTQVTLAGQVKQRPINYYSGSYEKTHIGELGRPAGDFKITRKGDVPYEYRGGLPGMSCLIC